MSFRIEADGDNAVERVRNALQGQDDDDIDSIVIEIEYGDSDWEEVLDSEILPDQTEETPANGLQVRFMEAVESNPGSTVSELAEAMGESNRPISPVASKVWKKGLVDRTNSVPYEYNGLTEWGEEQLAVKTA